MLIIVSFATALIVVSGVPSSKLVTTTATTVAPPVLPVTSRMTTEGPIITNPLETIKVETKECEKERIVTRNGRGLISCKTALNRTREFNNPVRSCSNVNGAPVFTYAQPTAKPTCAYIKSTYAMILNYTIMDCDDKVDCPTYRIDDRMSWVDGWVACHVIQGSNLASVTNFEEYRTTAMMVTGIQHKDPWAWIGLNDYDVEGVWRWAHDGAEVEYKRWIYAQPNGGVGQNCGVMQAHAVGQFNNIGYNDERCERKNPVICKVMV